jgi:hypothetical protein
MKGDLVCILVLFQNLRKIKKYLLEEFCQEVLTLHLLTITLRRNLNPPGFFFFKGHKTEGLQCVSDMTYKENNYF